MASPKMNRRRKFRSTLAKYHFSASARKITITNCFITPVRQVTYSDVLTTVNFDFFRLKCFPLKSQADIWNAKLYHLKYQLCCYVTPGLQVAFLKHGVLNLNRLL